MPGADEAASSSLAFAAVSHCVRTLLGPQTAYKIRGGEPAHEALTGSALVVLNDIAHGEHPALTLLLETCEGMQQTYGCGVTTIPCLTAELSAGVMELRAQGFGMRAILASLSEAVRWACAYIGELAQPLPGLTQLDESLNTSRTSVVPTKSSHPQAPSSHKEEEEEDTDWFFNGDEEPSPPPPPPPVPPASCPERAPSPPPLRPPALRALGMALAHGKAADIPPVKVGGGHMSKI